MKVCFINSFYAPEEVGGAERSVRTLAEALVQGGHEALVVCNGRTRESTRIAGVRVERLPIQNLYHPLDAGGKSALSKMLWHTVDSYNPMNDRLVRELLAGFRPDVLHTNTLAGLSVRVWGIAKALGLPIVHTLRDYYLVCPNTAMYKNQEPCGAGRCASCRMLSTPRISATKDVAAVVGNSRFILDKHLAHGCFAQASHHVIYNAYQPPAPVQVRAPLAGKPAIAIGYIGRLARTKGVEMLIQAYLAIRRERADLPLKLVVAGRGDADYEQSLRDMAAVDSTITFLGQVKPEAFYEQVDFPVVPSLWDEPLARVLFESFAHGLPVIASTTGGSPELIRDGENGWLFDPARPDALLDKLRLALSQLDRYPQWSATALEDATRFVPQRTLSDYVRLYESAAAAAPSRAAEKASA